MGHGNIGYTLIVVGIMIILAGFSVGRRSAEERISKRYQSASGAAPATQVSNGIDRRWTCDDRGPIEMGRELKEEVKPQAYSEDGGAAYPRTKKHLLVVSRQTPETEAEDTCLMTKESLSGRYSGKHFIYFGPGFGPSTPSSGSGGSAGSFGEAK